MRSRRASSVAGDGRLCAWLTRNCPTRLAQSNRPWSSKARTSPASGSAPPARSTPIPARPNCLTIIGAPLPPNRAECRMTCGCPPLAQPTFPFEARTTKNAIGHRRDGIARRCVLLFCPKATADCGKRIWCATGATLYLVIAGMMGHFWGSAADRARALISSRPGAPGRPSPRRAGGASGRTRRRSG